MSDTEWPTANTQDSVMMSLCGAERLYSSLDLYHAHIKHAHTYADTQLMHALSVSQISQSAGLSWAGCSKGKCGPKNTGCEVTMVTACPGALAAC